MKKITLAATLLAFSSALLAHDFWLSPVSYQIPEPGMATLSFDVGDGAKPDPWNLRWENIVSLRSYGPSSVVDQQAGIVPKTANRPGSARIQLQQPGTHWIAFESQHSLSDLDAEAFNAYLEHEGLSALIAERTRSGTSDENGTETYSRRAKLLLQVGAERSPQALQPIGQTLEIVPLKHPYELGDDRQLPVSVLFRGKPLPGATLDLVDLNGDGKPLLTQLTDANGQAIFKIPPSSRWRLGVVWSVPTPESSKAKYDTVFSSLTFGYD